LDTSTVDLSTALQTALEANPDIAFSRIISPRRLKPGTAYQAFLVPFFERGRLTGLGEDPTTAAVLDVAWSPNDLDNASKEFPFYYEWSFTTSVEEDFETLARKLKPQELANLPFAEMNVERTLTHFDGAVSTNDASKTVQIPSALVPIGQHAAVWPAPNSSADVAVQTAVQDDLNPVVDTANTPVTNVPSANTQEDIIVNKPPVYGKWHLDRTKWQGLNGALDANNMGWIHQLNTNLQGRALAGLGVRVVRDHQEKFMSTAWAQVGEIIEANKSINQHLLSREANHQLHKRVKGSTQDTTVALTGNIQSRVLYTNTPTNSVSVQQAIKGSNLSLAPTNSAFTKLRRPSSKAIKKLKKQAENHLTTVEPNQNFLNNINQTTVEELNGAPVKPDPYLVTGSSNHTSTTPSSSTSANNLANHLTTIGKVAPAPTDLATQQQAIKQAIDPLITVKRRLLDYLELPHNNSNALVQAPVDQLQPILAAPEIQEPLYPYLKEIAQQFVLPSLATYGDNFVGLMDINQAFVEQFLVGANHEMGRELMWRGYPTDQRGSYFRQFWNVKDHVALGQGHLPYKDISPIHTWDSSSVLGSHRPSGYPNTPTVLIIKGELLRANPDLVIYAHKAADNPNYLNNPNTQPKKILTALQNATTIKYPIFRANLNPDTVAIGLDLANPADWFFILKERPGKVKLGLDEGGTVPVQLNNYNDLHWQHMPTTSGGVTYIDPTQGLTFTGGANAALADNAAQLAHRLYQAPLMLGIHATRLLPATSILNPTPVNPSPL
jgi:hypothetical protein